MVANYEGSDGVVCHYAHPSRREVIAGAASASTVISMSSGTTGQSQGSGSGGGALLIPVNLTVNGTRHTLTLDSRSSLLHVLRERIGLTGAKKGCDHGQCGACTVHVEGRRVASCLTLAAQADRRQVTTIEGLAPADGELHPNRDFLWQSCRRRVFSSQGEYKSMRAGRFIPIRIAPYPPIE